MKPKKETKMKKKTVKKATKKSERYVIVRADRAGVFAGIFVSRKGQEIILKDARRIWYWDGAASLSQLAMEGTKAPENCKFPAPVGLIEVFGVLEIIDCTPVAEKSIREVKPWAR
jgi:hypothetical protein